MRISLAHRVRHCCRLALLFLTMALCAPVAVLPAPAVPTPAPAAPTPVPPPSVTSAAPTPSSTPSGAPLPSMLPAAPSTIPPAPPGASLPSSPLTVAQANLEQFRNRVPEARAGTLPNVTGGVSYGGSGFNDIGSIFGNVRQRTSFDHGPQPTIQLRATPFDSGQTRYAVRSAQSDVRG